MINLLNLYKKWFVFFILIISVSLFFGCSDRKEEAEKGKESPTGPSLSKPLFSSEEADRADPEGVEEERELKIGVIGPESGEESEYGLSVLQGIMLASKIFNAKGGINGKEIEILHFDNKGDPELTNEIIERLIQQGVLAILAAPTGWSTFAPTYQVNKSKTLFISIGTRRHIEKSGPYIFRIALPDELAIDEVIKFSMEELGYKNFALITSSRIDYSLDLSFLFKKAVLDRGGRIVVEGDTYDTYTGKANIEGVVKQIKDSTKNLHGVIYTGDGKEGAMLAQKAKREGLDIPFIGSEDLFTSVYLEGGNSVTDSVLYATFSPDRKHKGVVDFLETFKREYGKMPNRFDALAYDTFIFVGEAIKRAASTKPSLVRKTMLQMRDFEGVTGRLGFTSQGEPIKEPFIYMVRRRENRNEFVLAK